MRQRSRKIVDRIRHFRISEKLKQAFGVLSSGWTIAGTQQSYIRAFYS